MLAPGHRLKNNRKVDSAICPPTSEYRSTGGFEVARPLYSTRRGLLAVWVRPPLASPMHGCRSSSLPCLPLQPSCRLSPTSAALVRATCIEDRQVRICRTDTRASGTRHMDCMCNGMHSQTCTATQSLHRNSRLQTNRRAVRSSGSRDRCSSRPRDSESRCGVAV